LTGADLFNANLHKANLTSADLRVVIGLTQAVIGNGFRARSGEFIGTKLPVSNARSPTCTARAGLRRPCTDRRVR